MNSFTHPTGDVEPHPGHSQVDDRLRGGGQVFVVLAEATVSAQPGKGALHHPPAWDHGEADTIGGVAPGGSQRLQPAQLRR
jgi:hypothetical protein